MIRRWISALLVLCSLVWCAGAYAADIVPIAVVLDGEALEDGGMLYKGTAYVPLERFTERLGAAVFPAPHRCGYMIVREGHTFRFLMTTSRTYIDGALSDVRAYPLWHRGTAYVPVRALESFLGLRLLYDSEYRTLYVSSGADDAPPEGVRLPILMYHAVSDETWGYEELFVRPSELEEQIVYLLENGYTPVTFDDLGRLGEIEKPVMLTFDDGYLDNYTEAFPILEKYGVCATMFIVTNNLDDPRCVTPEMVREMDASGLVSIQSHSHTHPELTSLDEKSLEYELSRSRLESARLTGKSPDVLRYPSGKQNETVRSLASAYYDYGLIMAGDTVRTGRDGTRRWARGYVYRGMGLSAFKKLL